MSFLFPPAETKINKIRGGEKNHSAQSEAHRRPDVDRFPVSLSPQLCTDVLKGFYQVGNSRAEKGTKSERNLFTLRSPFLLLSALYLSIPLHPHPTTPHPPPPHPCWVNVQYQIQMPPAASCKSSSVNQSHRCGDGESWRVKDLGASW